MQLICDDCGSTNISITHPYEAWFKEGNINRRRIMTVKVMNGNYEVTCPELRTNCKGISKNLKEAFEIFKVALLKERHILLLANLDNIEEIQ